MPDWSNADFLAGYTHGDTERQWLAIANSELRSEVRALRQQLGLIPEEGTE